MISAAIRSSVPWILLATALPATAQTVWVEGERPARSSVVRHASWYDQVKKDGLSGGDWISHWSDEKPGLVEYAFDVPKAGRYAFWVRANHVGTRLDYALDRGEWATLNMAEGTIDATNMALDDKLDLRFLSWKKVGDVELAKGRHAIRFRMDSPNNHHGALDAFVFTAEAFLPRGKAKPGQGGASATAGTWPFLAERDTFRSDALLDLRGLNEKVAGEKGFVRLSADGEGFVLGDGSPARFWAVNTVVQRDKSADDLAHHARFLAKRGVNLVRLHGHLEPKEDGARLEDVDQKSVDEAWKLVAAMKKEGIYTALSPYWAANLKKVPASWGIEGWPEGTSPQGLLFFNERLQAAYKGWLKALLARPNPYTGVPLAKDPAVAILQIQNEDSLLFWTVDAIQGKQRELLGRKFGAWLVKKYGSLAAAKKAWSGESMPEDDLARGVVGLHIVWQLKQEHGGGLRVRLADQVRFYGETMRDFNKEIARYLREDLGCKQTINAGNWRTADAILLDDVERWSYAGNEVIGVNRYFSQVHVGPDMGWRIGAGDHYQDGSALTSPRDLPTNLRQVVGHPMIISESLWVPPVGFQSEAPLLVAAYQSLGGVDAFCWFSTADPEWSDQDRSPWDSASRAKWSFGSPMIQGQFPAAALLFRKGYLKRGEPAVVEHRSAEQLWGRVPPLIAEDPGYDPNRDLGDAAKRSNLRGGVDPLAFLVGPVQVAYDSDPKKTRVADLSRFIDRKAKVVRSDTGQIRLDYGRGVCRVDAPCVQGAGGFLKKAGPLNFGDVTIRSDDEYASVLVVSLDGKPLAESREVLVQVGTSARPSGWAERDATFRGSDGKASYRGKQVTDTGRMPWAIVDAKMALVVKNPKLKTATRLDPNGLASGSVKAEARDGGLAFSMPRDALYVVLRAE